MYFLLILIMFKRIFDIFVAGMGLIILTPPIIIIALLIKIDSKGPVFFQQKRVGKDEKEFKIFHLSQPPFDKSSSIRFLLLPLLRFMINQRIKVLSCTVVI